MRPLLLAALLLVAMAWGAAAAPPKDAVFALDGVEYLYITGVNRTGQAVLDTPDGEVPLGIESCAFVQLHPGTPNGRARIIGLQGQVPLEMYIDQFRLANGTRGYSFDKPVTEDGQARVADAAASGNGTLRVLSDRYYDPVSSSGDANVDREDPDLAATLNVLRDGVRDEAGAVVAGPGAKDPELHVHFRSNPEAVPETITYSFQPASAVIPPTEAYGATYVVPNLKLGGQATVALEASANAPDGMNTFVFTILSPSGHEIGNATLRPALLAGDSATLEFPLTEFGNYVVRVAGSVTLGSYTATVTLSPPPAFDLHMWWENVTYGRQAYLDYRACLDELESPNDIVATERIIGRPAPPKYAVALVGMGVVATAALVTTGIKLASDQVSLSAFRKSK